MPTRYKRKATVRRSSARIAKRELSPDSDGDNEGDGDEVLDTTKHEYYCKLKLLKKPLINEKLRLKAIGRFPVRLSADMSYDEMSDEMYTGVAQSNACKSHFIIQAKSSACFNTKAMQVIYDTQWEEVKPRLAESVKIEWFLYIKNQDEQCQDCILYNSKSSTTSKAADKRRTDKKKMAKAKKASYRRTVYKTDPTGGSLSPAPALRRRRLKRRSREMESSSSSSSSSPSKIGPILKRARKLSSKRKDNPLQQAHVLFGDMVVDTRIKAFVSLFSDQNEPTKATIMDQCCDAMQANAKHDDELYQEDLDDDFDDDYDDDEEDSSESDEE